MNGLELVRRLPRSRRPSIAVTSARERSVLEAFEVGAIDYLLKPVSAGRLRQTLDRAHERRKPHRGPILTAADRLPVRVGQDILLLPLDQIASIVAEGELLHVTTMRNERHTLTSQRLKDLEARLDPGGFLRLSRSALANARFITRLTPLPGGNYMATLANHQELRVSRSQARALRERLLSS
jgi:two-component system LytT family response regulator